MWVAATDNSLNQVVIRGNSEERAAARQLIERARPARATDPGQTVLGYARRMLRLNDELPVRTSLDALEWPLRRITRAALVGGLVLTPQGEAVLGRHTAAGRGGGSPTPGVGRPPSGRVLSSFSPPAAWARPTPWRP